jgi:hypothetical protein
MWANLFPRIRDYNLCVGCRPGSVLFLENNLASKIAIVHRRCRKSDDHPEEDLAK